jgi:hypothetical protein
MCALLPNHLRQDQTMCLSSDLAITVKDTELSAHPHRPTAVRIILILRMMYPVNRSEQGQG